MYRKFFFALFSLGICVISSAQTYYEKGKIMDSIQVSGTEKQTFALYLPNSFDPNRLSSIIFIFEPAARGKVGIQPFIKASEKYGHVLVCSNNSRNGPYERNFDIANKLFDHIFSSFSIKNDEMYLSGFSGGARLATSIASLTNQFAGVIACGAGFSHAREHRPSTQNYAYAGLCGDKDMNYREMLKNKGFLDLMSFNNTLITYDGNHGWPPENQILRAVDWLYLQKLKTANVDNNEILESYKSDYKLLGQMEEEEEILFAAEQYARILKDYQNRIQMDSLVEKNQILLSSTTYKLHKAALEDAILQENKLRDKLIKRMTLDFEKPNKANFKWWERELAKLDALDRKGGQEIKKMVYRVKFDLFARAYSRKNSLLYSTNEEQAQLVDQFLELIYPKEQS